MVLKVCRPGASVPIRSAASSPQLISRVCILFAMGCVVRQHTSVYKQGNELQSWIGYSSCCCDRRILKKEGRALAHSWTGRPLWWHLQPGSSDHCCTQLASSQPVEWCPPHSSLTNQTGNAFTGMPKGVFPKGL